MVRRILAKTAGPLPVQPLYVQVSSAMLRNPLARHIALFLLVKAVLIGLGLWWVLGAPPEPRGAVPHAPAAPTTAAAP